jgi:hypothetical protein
LQPQFKNPVQETVVLVIGISQPKLDERNAKLLSKLHHLLSFLLIALGRGLLSMTESFQGVVALATYTA